LTLLASSEVSVSESEKTSCTERELENPHSEKTTFFGFSAQRGVSTKFRLCNLGSLLWNFIEAAQGLLNPDSQKFLEERKAAGYVGEIYVCLR